VPREGHIAGFGRVRAVVEVSRSSKSTTTGTEGLDISASAMGSSRRAAQPLRLRRELEREYEAADLVPAVDPAVRVDDLRER
jgi:hypothetical protein